MTPINYKPNFGRLNIVFPNKRHVRLAEIIPALPGMRTVVLLNSALHNGHELSSLEDVRRAAGVDDLATAKAKLSLVEGDKLLPAELVEILIKGNRDDKLYVRRDEAQDTIYWEMPAFSYLSRDIVRQLSPSTGAFTIVPSDHRWLIHTRDDDPWIYLLLPSPDAQKLVSDTGRLFDYASENFPYN